jgi:ADP-ribose pyrophosphatase
MKVHNRKFVASNLRFDIYFDHVEDDLGNEVKEYLVVAPKNPGPNLVTGCAVLPIATEGVGLIRIYRPAIGDYSWEIPHGFIDQGESNESSALRELLEETGLTVDASQFTSLGYITPDSGVIAARVQLFVARGCYACQPISSELGLGGFKFFSFSEFEVMIKESVIQDSFTISAWYKYQQSLHLK